MCAEGSVQGHDGSSQATSEKWLSEMERDLHDLCQPVTSLQCRLELGKLLGGEDALTEATDGALEDASRIFEAVFRLRKRLMLAGKLEQME